MFITIQSWNLINSSNGFNEDTVIFIDKFLVVFEELMTALIKSLSLFFSMIFVVEFFDKRIYLCYK